MTDDGSFTRRPKGASDLFGSVPFALTRPVSPHGQITAVSMMKDEGPYLIEWVAHHLAVGFTDLVVYTNDCSDGTDDMLLRLEALGLAHHRRNVIPAGLRPQPSALNHAQVEPVVGQSDWVMVFDADEFLSIRHGDGTLDDLIGAAKAQQANGIVITWRIFGSGGVVNWSTAPVTEQYLQAAPMDWNKGWGVKTLFTFDPDYWKLGIHRPKMKTRHIKTAFPDQVKWLNGSGREMEDYFKFRGWRSISRTVGYDWAQMNHYAVKSVDSYAIRRLRGNVNNKADKYDPQYWALQDRNEVPDLTMLRYSEKRGAIMRQLLADPVLHQLHTAAVDLAEARLAEIRQTAQYQKLVADLAAASAVPLGQIVAKPPQPRDREKIAALMSDVEKQRSSKARDSRKSQDVPRMAARPGGGHFNASLAAGPDPQADWVLNNTVLLPLDAHLFAPPALAAVTKGKLDRPLIRRLSQVLAQGAVVLDIGASIGLIAAVLAATRPDLKMLMQEDDPGLRAAMARIYRHNGLALTTQTLLPDLLADAPATTLADLIARHRPDALLLSDPQVSPDSLSAGLKAPRPAQILLCGRLVETQADSLAAYDAALAGCGYQLGANAEPALLRVYAGG